MLDMVEMYPADRRRYLKIARVSGKLMLFLINDMLDFSAIVANHFSKRLAIFTIRDAIHEAVDVLRPLIEEKHIELRLCIATRLPQMIYCDKD